VLDDGTRLTTLREAVEYLARTVPKAEHNHPSVLNASDHLTRSAEQNYPMFFARAAYAAGHPPASRSGLQSGSQGPPLGKAKAEERPIADVKQMFLELKDQA
jgi:hypothetical protein